MPAKWIVAPAEIWLAPVGETFPEVDVAPSGNWAKLGSAGSKDYSEDGITITHNQSLNQFFGLGSTGPQKVSRDQEQLTIEGTLQDATLDEFSKIMNDVTVSAGTTGGGTTTEEINIRQGLSVSEFAMLVRTTSPKDATKTRQYQIPRVYQSGEPSPAYTKDGTAGASFKFTALEDENAATDAEKFGQIVDGA